MTFHASLQNILLGALALQTCTVANSSPSFNFLTVSNWLAVKFHYLLIGQNVKILNNCSSLVTNDNVVSRDVTRWTPLRVPLVFLSVRVWLTWYTHPRCLRCPETVKVTNFDCSRNFPTPLLLTVTNGEQCNHAIPDLNSLTHSLSLSLTTQSFYTDILQFPFHPKLNHRL
jgi:hypothetical protein